VVVDLDEASPAPTTGDHRRGLLRGERAYRRVVPVLRDLYEGNDYPASVDGHPVVLRHGRACPSLDELLERRSAPGAAYLTACDPHPRELEPDENRRRNAEMCALLAARHEVSDAPGGWPPGQAPSGGGPEPSFLVLGISLEEATDIALRFEQAALVYHARGATTRVVMLREE
jgi:hypothetical protein